MTSVIKTSQLILLISCVTFVAHVLAEPPEEVKNGFISHRRQQRETRRLADNSAIIEQTENWAGAVQSPPPSGTFNSVSAQWTLPTVSLPLSANGTGTWSTAIWVGIDGYNCTKALLQAGTTSYIEVSDTDAVTNAAYAWYEWVPNPESSIKDSDFSVAAGDTVEVTVTATSSSNGTATLNNLSTGQGITVDFSAPSNSSELCGKDAEWIVEDAESGGEFVPFAIFSTVTMSNCVATTTTGDAVDLTNAQLLEIAQNGTVLASPVDVSSSEFQVSYG